MEEEKKLNSKIFLEIGIVALITSVSVIILFLIYNAVFAQRVYWGVYVGNKNVSGMTYSDLYNYLESKSSEFEKIGINYKFQDSIYNINSTSGEIVDAGAKLIYFENDKTAKQAFSFGRNSNIVQNFLNQFFALIYPKKIKLNYDFNSSGWENLLKKEFSKYETNFVLPKVSFENGEIKILEPQEGQVFEYEKIIQKTEKQINSFNFSEILLELKIKETPVSIEQANEKLDLVKSIAELGELSLKYKEDSWKIKSNIYKNWLVIKNLDDKILVGLDFENYKKYMNEKIAPNINVEVNDAKFSIQGGRVLEFVGAKDGQEVDLEKTLLAIEENLNNLIKETEIIVNTTKSNIATKDVNDLGIKEIIGTGESDFKGSPKNRIHNIKTGADKLNGLLVAPGEEFYTIKNLLPIDAEGGYLTELVIKGNRTKPEYGGGLCQIGTTMFRAAVQSGLKITQRREHSYRVVYYEPAGTDATIYDPMPDLRFINDTGNYILIQSRIVGTKVYFDFWGTKDGRKISVGDPVIYNIRKPGPTKEIVSPELKPGERKCIETSHNGADAYFDYKIEYSDGTLHEQRFSSHYVPWQAVCLVGGEPAEAEVEAVSESDAVKTETTESPVAPITPTNQ